MPSNLTTDTTSSLENDFPLPGTTAFDPAGPLEPFAQPTVEDLESIERVTARLDQLEKLEQELAGEEVYSIPPLDFDLPAGFKLSIVIPVYNERNTIRTILARVMALPVPKEVLIVDDCSTDGTRDVLAELCHPEIRVVLKEKNGGKGAALHTGFAAATGDVVIVQDADLEYDPKDIGPLLRPIVENQADVVFGSRFIGETHDKSLVHKFGNWALTFASNVTTGLRLTDMETCYKAFRRELLQSIPLKQARFGFEPEVTAKLARRKARVCELPISYQPRGYADGKKIGIKDLFNALWCIARYGWAD